MKKYLVGGAVRDKLLGLVPKDRDWLVVGATEQDIDQMMAEGYTQVGADFPVLLHPDTAEEYALARVERKSGVGYHGFEVKCDPSVTVEEDLSRRDLTINSMAMDENGVLVDPFNGLKDLRNRMLRHTTEAFAEDPLRVIRLARFAARLSNWSVAPETMKLCDQITKSGELNHLSVERLWAEMEKGFNEVDPGKFMAVLTLTGALEHCDFLNDLFGSYLTEHGRNVIEAMKTYDMKRDKLVLHVATMARATSKLQHAPTRVRDCFDNLHMLGTLFGSAEDMFKMLKKARVMSEGPQFEDFVAAVQVCEFAKKSFVFSAKQILIAAKTVRGVRASDFAGLTGKELGDAMQAKKIRDLQLVMGDPESQSSSQMS